MSIVILTIYLTIVCFAMVIGLIQFPKLDKASKILVFYLAATFLTEGTASILAIFYKTNNLFLYHIYSPLQFLLISLYYSYSAGRSSAQKWGWIIGSLGIVISILNSIYLQPLQELNTHFVVLESFLIIGMSLLAFYRLLISDDISIFKMPHFWFSSIFLVFWSFTFFYWLVGAFIFRAMPGNTMWLKMMIWFINIITYFAIATVFLSYKKMKPA